MAVTVVYDACVLFPAPLRDLLLRIAHKGVVRARWTDRILDECFASVAAQRPDLSPARLAKTRQLMVESTADGLIENYQSLIGSLTLPDGEDRHVLAAAIRAHAQIIVTTNLRDFPEAVLRKYDIEAQHPDVFVMVQLDLDEAAVVSAFRDQVANLKAPPRTSDEVLMTLHNCGLVRSAARLRMLVEGTGSRA